MRLDRLLGMTLELMAKQRVTAAQLADKFEVSARTVYRDIELIGQAGIPVVSFSGADGGFELAGGSFVTRQHFSVDDLTVVYSLLKAMEGAMGGAVASPMRKPESLRPELANGGAGKPSSSAWPCRSKNVAMLKNCSGRSGDRGSCGWPTRMMPERRRSEAWSR